VDFSFEDIAVKVCPWEWNQLSNSFCLINEGIATNLLLTVVVE